VDRVRKRKRAATNSGLPFRYIRAAQGFPLRRVRRNPYLAQV